MNTTPEIKAAMKHVKSVYPNVSIVIFTKDLHWQYMDEDFESPIFDDRIDVGILEAAADSLTEYPYIYQE